MSKKDNVIDSTTHFEREWLSALVDGELEDDALLDTLSDDAALAEKWQDYHVIGDVIRGDAPQNIDWDIAGNVALALEGEPTYQAETPAVDNVVPLESQPAPEKARRGLPAWLNPFGQIATAATVALVAILGVQSYNSGAPDGTELAASPAQVSVLETVPFAGSAQPVSLSTRPAADASAAPTEAQLMEQRRRINAMLQDYELQLRLNANDGSVDRRLMEEELQVRE